MKRDSIRLALIAALMLLALLSLTIRALAAPATTTLVSVNSLGTTGGTLSR